MKILKSVGALFAGFVAVVVLSVATDLVMVALGWFPPLGQPNFNSKLLFFAWTYRSVYGVLGAYIVARLAPSSPMLHALVSGVIGLVLSTIGAIAMWNRGPNWYPLALAATTVPGAWIGGRIFEATKGRNQK